jgi:phasin family protein
MTTKGKIVDVTTETTKGFEATLESMKEGIAKATYGFEASQAKMKEQMAKAVKTTEDFVAFSQGNVEAMIKASQIFTTGMQDLSKHFAASTQASVEESMATAKALSGVKSVKEAVELQTGFARTLVEKMVSETSKLTDASLKITEQAIAPLTARMTKAVETFSTKI